MEVFMNAIYFSDAAGKRSSRIIFLGSLYALVGILALVFASATTLFAVATLGVLLLCVGIAEIVYAIRGRANGQLWPHLAFGCLALICGGLIFINPIENTLGLTLIVSFFLIAAGLAKVVGAVAERASGWGWFAANGVISIILGAIIIGTFPYSATWTIGTFVGIDLIAGGALLIGLGASAKRIKRELTGETFSTLNPEEKERRTDEHAPMH